jgi:hypothetical protein
MSRRHNEPSDSLDMLLDTLCNTFGGLVFIAMLLAIVNSTSVTEKVSDATAQKERIEREQKRAETRLEELKTKLAAFAGKKDETASFDKLEAAHEKLAKLAREEAVLRAQIDNSETSLLKTEQLDQSKLDATLRELQAKLAQATSESAAAIEEIARLTTRLAELGKALAKTKKPKIEKFRLPKENKSLKKDSIYVCVRNGKIYPTHKRSGKRISLNTETLEWEMVPGGQRLVFERSIGWEVGETVGTEWIDYLAEIPKGEYYLSFLVWDDSFDVMRQAKRIATEKGFSIGWEPFSRAFFVLVSSGGAPPPPPQ